jgi:hypothetical protein
MIFTIVAAWCLQGKRTTWTRWISPPLYAGRAARRQPCPCLSPNGQFVSFTYNDHVLHERDPALDLRNVGVAAPMAR